jgi:ankyrin repeat protein
MSQETLDYILENLRILEEENKEKEILKGISHHILIMNSQLFKSVYKREEEEEGNSLPINLAINIRSLLVRDPRGMTRLHRAALCEDEKTVNQILETIRISYLSNETEAKNLGKEVLHNVIASDEKGETPLYLAAACEHEKIFQKMLSFLKKMLPQDELRTCLTNTNGFLGNASWNAIDWNKDEIMFQIVLKSVQKFLGQDYLIALLKAANQTYKGCKGEYRCCNHEKWFEFVLEVTANVNVENGNKLLFDLLFQNTSICLYRQLHHIDNKRFQEMISVNELEAFMERLFGIDEQDLAMHCVVCGILDKFTDEQRVQLCRILIKEESYGKSYFNRWWFDSIEGYRRYYRYTSPEILKCISDNLGQSVVNELLVNNEHEVIKRALRSGGFYGAELVDFMLTFLSNKEEEKIHHMMTIVMQLIEKITENCENNYYTRNALEFVCPRVENCVTENDLSKLIDLITNRASIESEEINIWIDYLVWKGASWQPFSMRQHAIVDKFLKCVLDKFGQFAVEKLVKKEAVTQVLIKKDSK